VSGRFAGGGLLFEAGVSAFILGVSLEETFIRIS
jgi:hypothetical protein